MMATKRFKITIDARTRHMTGEALMCRAVNHPWQRTPLTPSRKRELLRNGQTETVWHCLRCGSRRTDRFTLPDFDTVSSKIEYAEGYLVGKEFAGSGKLPRREARKAMYVYEIPELV